MFIADLILVFILSLAGTALLAYELKRSGSYTHGIIFMIFLLMLLGIWAGGVWIVPLGPPILGVYWVSFISVGIFLTVFIMSMLSGSGKSARRSKNTGNREADPISVLSFDMFFVFLLFFFVAAILSHYFL